MIEHSPMQAQLEGYIPADNTRGVFNIAQREAYNAWHSVVEIGDVVLALLDEQYVTQVRALLIEPIHRARRTGLATDLALSPNVLTLLQGIRQTSEDTAVTPENIYSALLASSFSFLDRALVIEDISSPTVRDTLRDHVNPHYKPKPIPQT